MSTILYAEKHPEDVLAIAPISPVVSGTLSLEAHERHDPEYVSRWRESGWKEEKSESIPGLLKRLKWSHVEDRLRYDVLPDANKLTMPALLVVGEFDVSTPPDHIQILFDALQGQKTFYVITGASHNFRKPEELRELKETILEWIDTI
jgi:pimeloyl-ACP methyl ester carboxylesterase